VTIVGRLPGYETAWTLAMKHSTSDILQFHLWLQSCMKHYSLFHFRN